MKKRTGVLDGPKIKKLQRVNNQPVGDGALDVPKTNDYRKQKRAIRESLLQNIKHPIVFFDGGCFTDKLIDYTGVPTSIKLPSKS